MSAAAEAPRSTGSAAFDLEMRVRMGEEGAGMGMTMSGGGVFEREESVPSLETRLVAGFLALVGLASAIWPVALNRAFANEALERILWRDPGPVLRWVTRLFSVYWTLVWGWFAVFGRLPPYFPSG